VRHHFKSLPIIVPCLVAGPAGSGEPKLLLDTGASITVLDSIFLKMIGLDPVNSKDFCFLTTANGVIRAPIVSIASFTALGITRKNLPVAAHRLPSQSYVSGLLGTDFLCDQIMVVNFKNRWVEIK